MERKRINIGQWKMKKGKAACILILFLLVLAWGHQVYAVNRLIPQTEIRVMKGRRWNPWKDGIEVKVNKADFMSDSAIRETKGTENVLYNYEMKLMWVDLQIRNSRTEEKMVDLLDIAAESEGWCNIPDVQFYDILGESSKPLRLNIEPGETLTYRLPYLFVKANFRNPEWKRIEDKDYYLTLSLYPEKKMIHVP